MDRGAARRDARDAASGPSGPSTSLPIACSLPKVTRRCARLLVLVAVLCVPGHAAAQGFGQWWWEGLVGLAQRETRNSLDGATVSETRDTDLRVATALNGYLGHPALGNFRVGIDWFVSNDQKDRRLDTSRLGFDLDLNLLSKGAFPANLYARRQVYGYSDPGDDDLLPLLRLPDVGTEWGGWFRMRRGPLKGTMLAFTRRDTEYTGENEGDTFAHQFIDWSRIFGRLQNHLTLNHEFRDFGFQDFSVDTLTANLDQKGPIAPAWRWNLFASAILRDAERLDGTTTSTESFRFNHRVQHQLRETDRFDIVTSAGFFETGQAARVDTYGLAFFYHWNPTLSWDLAPFAQYATQSSDDLSLVSRRLGVWATWTLREHRFDTMLTGSVSYGGLSEEDGLISEEQSQTAFAFSGTFGHGQPSRLRKELEIGLGRNDLRVDREPLLEFPDLGLPRDGLGRDDYGRARVTLTHVWDSRTLSGWGEWSRRQSPAGLFQESDFRSDRASASAQFNGHKYEFVANVGRTSVDRGPSDFQEVRFLRGQAAWRVTRSVRLRALYGHNRRDLLVSPDWDTTQFQVGVSVNIGQFVFDGLLTQLKDSTSGGPERESRAIRWGLNRRFASWLPVRTGTQRRGVIR